MQGNLTMYWIETVLWVTNSRAVPFPASQIPSLNSRALVWSKGTCLSIALMGCKDCNPIHTYLSINSIKLSETYFWRTLDCTCSHSIWRWFQIIAGLYNPHGPACNVGLSHDALRLHFLEFFAHFLCTVLLEHGDLLSSVTLKKIKRSVQCVEFLTVLCVLQYIWGLTYSCRVLCWNRIHFTNEVLLPELPWDL